MKLEKVNDYLWRVPIGAVPGMNVPGLVYASEKLLAHIRQEGALKQVANAATLPGVVKASLAMPDIHYGYGFPIGGVLATRVDGGVISPGGVGFDINCGVRLLKTPLDETTVRPVLQRLVEEMFREVPSGVGSSGKIRLKRSEVRRVLSEGSRWAVKQGFGLPRDLDYTEAGGCLPDALPDEVSLRAIQRGADQLGTLGSGNHFIEIQVVERIFNARIAAVYGLSEGQVTVMIHSGSRGLGHQVCTDFLKVMIQALNKYGIRVPDRQLACAPLASGEGKRYLGALRCAANFAWANRQCLMHWVRDVFCRVFPERLHHQSMDMLYDVAHNIVKIETHDVDGKNVKLAVHRKGATRAFGPGAPGVPRFFREAGQPVLIPGDMGTASYVLAGTETAMRETFGSACHGAGRQLSRAAAKRAARGRSITRELAERGITVMAAGKRTIVEEMPDAYKAIDEVVEVVRRANLAVPVARMKPLGVIKG